MKDEVEKLIAQWEDVTYETIPTMAGRTIAIMTGWAGGSAGVPKPVRVALGDLLRVGPDVPTRSEIVRDVSVVKQYLRSLL